MSRTIGRDDRSTSRIGRDGLFATSWPALLALCLLCPWLAGCEDIPTFQELISGGEEEEQTDPAAEAPPAQPMRRQEPRAEPEPVEPKRTPEEVLADFRQKMKQPRRIADSDLEELASLEEGLDEFTRLDVSKSAVTNRGLIFIAKLPNVKQLNIGDVRFSNNGLKPISEMQTLEVLSLENTPVYGSRDVPKEPEARYLDTGLEHIKNLPNLRRLNLSGTKLTRDGLIHISTMVQLEALILAGTSINNDDLAMLETLVNLKELDVSSTGVTDEGCASLVYMPQLEILRMAHTRTTGMGLFELDKSRKMPPLRHLKVDSTQFGDYGFKAIQGMQTLEYLDVGMTGANDDNLVVLRSLRNLQKVYLHENPRVTNNALQHLRGLRELETVYLRDLQNVNNDGLAHLKNLKKLRRLVLTDTACNINGAKALKKHLPDLTVFFGSTEI